MPKSQIAIATILGSGMEKRALSAKVRLLKGLGSPFLDPQVFLGRPDSHSRTLIMLICPHYRKIGALFDLDEKRFMNNFLGGHPGQTPPPYIILYASIYFYIDFSIFLYTYIQTCIYFFILLNISIHFYIEI